MCERESECSAVRISCFLSCTSASKSSSSCPSWLLSCLRVSRWHHAGTKGGRGEKEVGGEEEGRGGGEGRELVRRLVGKQRVTWSIFKAAERHGFCSLRAWSLVVRVRAATTGRVGGGSISIG